MNKKSKNDLLAKRWQVLVNKGKGGSTNFLYAVSTTGVFCRPGCSSRLPNRKNVEFFDTVEDAIAAGYRACRRCRPDNNESCSRTEKKIIAACRMIEEADCLIKLAELADRVEMSPSYFHRTFKKIVGVTPRGYAAMRRAKAFRKGLEKGETVTGALYGAGFGSSSRVYENPNDHLAMHPSAFRKGGKGESIKYSVVQCSMGWLLVAATVRGICTVEFGDGPEELEKLMHKRFPLASIVPADSQFAEHLALVVQHIESPGASAVLPLDIRGTAFQQRVWAALRTIPAGETRTYGQVAEEIGNPQASRAVASACGANRLAVIIPCHRVVAKDDSLGGYKWGKEKKKQLLDKESSGA